jgi:hypothetical protein
MSEGGGIAPILLLTLALNGDIQRGALTGLPPVPTEHQAAWVLYPVWTHWRIKPHILLRPAHSTVTILTELSQLYSIYVGTVS